MTLSGDGETLSHSAERLWRAIRQLDLRDRLWLARCSAFYWPARTAEIVRLAGSELGDEDVLLETCLRFAMFRDLEWIARAALARKGLRPAEEFFLERVSVLPMTLGELSEIVETGLPEEFLLNLRDRAREAGFSSHLEHAFADALRSDSAGFRKWLWELNLESPPLVAEISAKLVRRHWILRLNDVAVPNAGFDTHASDGATLRLAMTICAAGTDFPFAPLAMGYVFPYWMSPHSGD